jgi:hypothetical protein
MKKEEFAYYDMMEKTECILLCKCCGATEEKCGS